MGRRLTALGLVMWWMFINLWHLAESAIEMTLGLNTTVPLPTTTLPNNPGKIMYIIIPVSILVGIPIVCSGYLCVKAVIHCIQKSKKGRDSRRVTPINGDPDLADDSTRIHNITLSQDPELITYDQVNGGGDRQLETQPHYNYGWDF